MRAEKRTSVFSSHSSTSTIKRQREELALDVQEREKKERRKRTEVLELELLKAEVMQHLTLLLELEDSRASEREVKLGCRRTDSVGNVERVAAVPKRQRRGIVQRTHPRRGRE